MHACCAPCFSYIEYDIRKNGMMNEDLKMEEVELHAFWHNFNIHPKFEYERRKKTFIDFCTMKDVPYYINDTYELYEFTKNVVTKVGENKEYNIRCKLCYYERLKEVFKFAKENNFDYVSTTLTISPYQNHEIIKEVLKRLEDEYGVKSIYMDYRKHFKEGQALAKELGLYRQKYCGCIYSMDSGKWVY